MISIMVPLAIFGLFSSEGRKRWRETELILPTDCRLGFVEAGRREGMGEKVKMAGGNWEGGRY